MFLLIIGDDSYVMLKHVIGTVYDKIMFGRHLRIVSSDANTCFGDDSHVMPNAPGHPCSKNTFSSPSSSNYDNPRAPVKVRNFGGPPLFLHQKCQVGTILQHSQPGISREETRKIHWKLSQILHVTGALRLWTRVPEILTTSQNQHSARCLLPGHARGARFPAIYWAGNTKKPRHVISSCRCIADNILRIIYSGCINNRLISW